MYGPGQQGYGMQGQMHGPGGMQGHMHGPGGMGMQGQMHGPGGMQGYGMQGPQYH